jgi:hypothetical protein
MSNAHLQDAIALRKIYWGHTAFPSWVIDPAMWPKHCFSDTIAFHHAGDSVEDVKKLLLEREPCNIGMRRIYDQNKLQETFGWRTGAYGAETPMPNIAVYCNATVHTEEKGFFNVRVLNLIGCALDSPAQPDFKRYATKQSLIQFYREMWTLALGALKHLGAKTFQIYNVGGGAFSGPYGNSFTTEIFEPAFLPLLPEFQDAGIRVLGYDFEAHAFNGGFIPDCLNEPTQDLENTVYVNAWDPWSMIGNGNEFDGSLDGYWGRCSNMSVLGWLKTNPGMKIVGV